MVNKVLCVVVSLSIAVLRCAEDGAVNTTTGSPTSYQTGAGGRHATGKKHQFLYL